MQLNDKRAWLYSVKLYMAAVATLGISLLGGLARPYLNNFVRYLTIFLINLTIWGFHKTEAVDYSKS